MFTGLIAEKGKIVSLWPDRDLIRIELEAHLLAPEMKIGDSLAVNGICLTVVQIAGSRLSIEAVPETRERTTLPDWHGGDEMNLERSLALNGRLDGHLVSGHVDGVAVVRAIRIEGSSQWVELVFPEALGRFVAEKGSVALNGVSLTVAKIIPPDRFSVALIPQTLATTNLRNLKIGSRVNIEVDMIARYLDRLQNAGGRDGLSLVRLRSAGF